MTASREKSATVTAASGGSAPLHRWTPSGYVDPVKVAQISANQT
jgi:hypothetical protein